jgi:hypothetical protein
LPLLSDAPAQRDHAMTSGTTTGSDGFGMLPYRGRWPVAAGVLAGLLLRFVFSGGSGGPYVAMMNSFIIGAPVLVSVVTVYLAERAARRTWGYYFVAPFVANVLFVVGTLLIEIEGWICAIIIVPLFAVVGGLAGLAMGAICRVTRWPRRAIVGCAAVLPLLGGAVEQRVDTTNLRRVQQREVFIAAAPADVWRVLVDTRDIRPAEVDRAWMYRIGVPTPQAGLGDFRDGEHLRHITMGKGVHFDQVASEWEENRRITWRYRFAPDSFPAGALDDHVRIGGEYFDVSECTYSLAAVPGGTRLAIRMDYRVSTHFNWYAAPVADWLVGDFAEVILDFYARRASAAAAQAGSS